MRTKFGVLALALAVTLSVPAVAEDEKEDMADNPMFKFWAKFPPGATSTYREVTKHHGPEKEGFPGGVEEKTVTYRLLNKTKDKAVVVTTVVEEDFLGTVETSPTKHTYPAKVKKANLEAVLKEFGAKHGDPEKVKVGKDEIECKVLAGSHKKGDATVEYKLCYSDTVPGGIVKRMRTTKEGDKVIAETTITLRSYNVPKPKEKDKKKDDKKKDDKEKEKAKAKEDR